MTIETNKQKVLDLGISLGNCNNDSKTATIDEISSFFIEGRHLDNMVLLGNVQDTAWLNNRAIKIVVNNLEHSYDATWLLARAKEDCNRHPQILTRYRVLLEKEFAEGSFHKKLVIFHELRLHTAPHNKALLATNQAFREKHWQDLIWPIDTVDKGINVNHAIRGFLNNGESLEIWATVAALKTLEVWAKGKSAADMALDYAPLLNKLTVSSSPLAFAMAQEIYKKM